MSPDRSENLHPGHRPPNSLDTLHLKIKPPPPPSSSVWDPVWPSLWDPESQTGQRLHTRRCKHPHRDLTSRDTNAQKLRKCTPRDKGTQSVRGAWTTVHNIHSDKISRSLTIPQGPGEIARTQAASVMSHPAIHVPKGLTSFTSWADTNPAQRPRWTLTARMGRAAGAGLSAPRRAADRVRAKSSRGHSAASPALRARTLATSQRRRRTSPLPRTASSAPWGQSVGGAVNSEKNSTL